MALPIKPLPVPFLDFCCVLLLLKLVFFIEAFVCTNGTIRVVGRGTADGKLGMDYGRNKVWKS